MPFSAADACLNEALSDSFDDGEIAASTACLLTPATNLSPAVTSRIGNGKPSGVTAMPSSTPATPVAGLTSVVDETCGIRRAILRIAVCVAFGSDDCTTSAPP